MCRCSRTLNAPSGIAQLRKSVDQVAKNDDHMNLDDFIVPSSIGTPAGISPSPSGEHELSSTATTVSAIPIKQHMRLREEELHISRASAPSMPPADGIRSNQEFGYLQRHVRKTSIDERRVRARSVVCGRRC